MIQQIHKVPREQASKEVGNITFICRLVEKTKKSDSNKSHMQQAGHTIQCNTKATQSITLTTYVALGGHTIASPNLAIASSALSDGTVTEYTTCWCGRINRRLRLQITGMDE